jgi:hypothetical protein
MLDTIKLYLSIGFQHSISHAATDLLETGEQKRYAWSIDCELTLLQSGCFGGVAVRRAISEATPQRRVPSRDPKIIRAQSPRAVQRANPFPACLALIGIIVPSQVQVLIAGAKLTAGRIGVILLLIPALVMLCRRGRHALASDFFACATGAWMIAAAVRTGGWDSLPSAGAEVLELIGGYFIARGFFFGPAALDTFIRVLRVFAVAAILLAMADTVSHRWIVQDTVAAIFDVPPPGPVYRGNLVRATSTFDHPILFGIFCSLVAAISLYSKLDMLPRILLVGLCIIGCILSLSSVAWMSLLIVIAVYTYDQIMRQYAWRWYPVWIGIAALLSALFLISNHPIGWLISHLTLDPESGYFRLLIWDAALIRINQFPLTGFGFNLFNHAILDSTIDSVWLVCSLRFGLPMIIFLILTNVAAFWPTRQRFKNPAGDPYMDKLRRAFTLVLVMFMFSGLTVHFWNFMWIFWGLCIGIRASLREQSSEATARSTP